MLYERWWSPMYIFSDVFECGGYTLLILCLILLQQEAAEDLAPRLEPILQHLMYAFGTYQVCSFGFQFNE
jgi:hypothetical protein